jgi:hypothetical protein
MAVYAAKRTPAISRPGLGGLSAGGAELGGGGVNAAQVKEVADRVVNEQEALHLPG